MEIQSQGNFPQRHMSLRNLKLNVVLYHQHRGSVHSQALLNINGEILPYAPKTNILWVVFDYKLAMKEQIDKRINAAKYSLL